MNTLALVLALMVASPSVHAAEAAAEKPDAGIDSAFAVCNTIPFTSDKEACLETVNHATYFQPSLVQLCGAQFPHDVKPKCLALVADKTVHETALKGCKDKKFWDDLSACLGRITKPYAAPAAASPSPAADKICKKERVSSLIDGSIEKARKARYLEMYDSLVQLRAQLTLCGFD